MRISLWQLARFCDRAPAPPGLSAPCRRGGRGTFRESSLMVLVLVAHLGRWVRPGSFRDPYRGAGGAPASSFGAWALVGGGMQAAGWELVGLPVVRRPDTSPRVSRRPASRLG